MRLLAARNYRRPWAECDDWELLPRLLDCLDLLCNDLPSKPSPIYCDSFCFPILVLLLGAVRCHGDQVLQPSRKTHTRHMQAFANLADSTALSFRLPRSRWFRLLDCWGLQSPTLPSSRPLTPRISGQIGGAAGNLVRLHALVSCVLNLHILGTVLD